MTEADAQQFGKLRWRCRRGIKELDVLLTRYMDERFRNAPAAERAAFANLLEGQDNTIYAYCFGQQDPPTAELSALVGRITAAAADKP
jgi:antitoxin CptB